MMMMMIIDSALVFLIQNTVIILSKFNKIITQFVTWLSMLLQSWFHDSFIEGILSIFSLSPCIVPFMSTDTLCITKQPTCPVPSCLFKRPPMSLRRVAYRSMSGVIYRSTDNLPVAVLLERKKNVSSPAATINYLQIPQERWGLLGPRPISMTEF